VIVLRSGDRSSVRREPRWSRVYQPRLTLYVFVAMLAIRCTAQEPSGQSQPPDQQNIVHGTVVNAVTHEPIGRALVFSPDNRFATLTDGEGHFEFTLPKANTGSGVGYGGSFLSSGHSQRMWSTGTGSLSWLTARKPGFLNDPKEQAQIEAFQGSEIIISLMPEALIKGRVTVSAADAASGVNVQIFSQQVQDGTTRWMPGTSVRTNSNGEFRFAELLPGAYKLVTHEWMDNDPIASIPGSQLYGFPPVFYPSATDFDAASTIQVTAGQTYQADLSIIRQPYYPVTIPVASSESIAGVGITVSPNGHRSPGYSLGYVASKQTIEGSLPKGNYLVEAATYRPNQANGSVTLAVPEAAGAGSNLILIPKSSININVVEEFTSTDRNSSMSWSDGHHTFALRGPRTYLQDIRLEATDDFEQRGGGSLRQSTGPNDESLVIENLLPGRYWLRVRPSRGYVASATRDGVDLLRQPLVVGSGANTPIEIKMRDDTAEIDGTVAGIAAQSGTTDGATFGAGISSPHAWISCVPLGDSPGQYEQTPVSSEGKFNAQNLAPGTYRVMAFKKQHWDLPYREAEAMRAYESKGQVVHLSPGQKANVQLQIISDSD
jgi:hypothetical protein